jgi:hypothetical protein
MKQHFEAIRAIIQAHVPYPGKVTVGVPPSGDSNEIFVKVFNAPDGINFEYEDDLLDIVDSIEDEYLVQHGLQDYIILLSIKDSSITKKYYPEHYQE